MKVRYAVRRGHAAGVLWTGPNGDGTMGALSATHIEERAERFVSGCEFRDFIDGPTARETLLKRAWLRGFACGRAKQAAYLAS